MPRCTCPGNRRRYPQRLGGGEAPGKSAAIPRASSRDAAVTAFLFSALRERTAFRAVQIDRSPSGIGNAFLDAQLGRLLDYHGSSGVGLAAILFIADPGALHD